MTYRKPTTSSLKQPTGIESGPQADYNDPLLSSYWYLWDAIGPTKGANVVRVWADYRGAGIKVAIIDDGFDYTHPELAPSYATALFSTTPTTRI